MKENFSKAFEGYFQWIIRAGEISNKNKQLVGGAWPKKPCPYRPYLPSPLLHIAYGSRPVVFILLYIYILEINIFISQIYYYFHHLELFIIIIDCQQLFYKEITVSCSGVGNLCPQPKRFFLYFMKNYFPLTSMPFLANLISFPFGSSILCILFIKNKYELPFVLGSRLKKLKMPKSIDFKGIFFSYFIKKTLQTS